MSPQPYEVGYPVGGRAGERSEGATHRPATSRSKAKGKEIVMAVRIPQLVALRYGNPYCAVCKNTLHPGWLVAWWPTKAGRKTVYCSACHRERAHAVADSVQGRRSRRPSR
jgi:hypothetical protein